MVSTVFEDPKTDFVDIPSPIRRWSMDCNSLVFADNTTQNIKLLPPSLCDVFFIEQCQWYMNSRNLSKGSAKTPTKSTLGWSVKKNVPGIVTKFGTVVGSLSWTTQKKFELPRWKGKRAGGSQMAPSFGKTWFFFCFFQLVKMACDLWNSFKKVQFEFLYRYEPPPTFSD